MNVFLDLDGTLTDPKRGITQSVAHALNELGLPVPPPDRLTWVIGPALLDSFAKLGTPDPERALAIYRGRYTDVGLFENHVYAGIPEALQALAKLGFTMYLATAKPHQYARRITAHFGLSGYFRHEYGPELDGTRNDKAELLAYALADTGIRAAQSVMVGDRIHDFVAARHVGMRSIGVSWGYGGAQELSQADAICTSPADLPDVISRMLVG